jgi:hypothetical protein
VSFSAIPGTSLCQPGNCELAIAPTTPPPSSGGGGGMGISGQGGLMPGPGGGFPAPPIQLVNYSVVQGQDTALFFSGGQLYLNSCNTRFRATRQSLFGIGSSGFQLFGGPRADGYSGIAYLAPGQCSLAVLAYLTSGMDPGVLAYDLRRIDPGYEAMLQQGFLEILPASLPVPIAPSVILRDSFDRDAAGTYLTGHRAEIGPPYCRSTTSGVYQLTGDGRVKCTSNEAVLGFNINNSPITGGIGGVLGGVANATISGVWNFNGNPGSDVGFYFNFDDFALADVPPLIVLDALAGQFYFYDPGISATFGTVANVGPVNLTADHTITLTTSGWNPTPGVSNFVGGLCTATLDGTTTITGVAPNRFSREGFGAAWGIAVGFINFAGGGETLRRLLVTTP